MKKIIRTGLFFAFALTAGVLSANESALVKDAMAETDKNRAMALIDGIENPQDADEWLAVGIVYHNFNDNQKSLLDKSLSACKRSEELGGGALALGYQGSILTVISSWYNGRKDFFNATAKLEKGLRLIDKAVRMDPVNTTLRILRLSNNLGVTLNSPVKLWDNITEDVAVLTKMLPADDHETHALLHYAMGQKALWAGDMYTALEEMETIIKLYPDSAVAVQANELLWELED